MESIKIIKRRRKSNWINGHRRDAERRWKKKNRKICETKRSAQYYITFMCTWARFLSVVQFQPRHCARPLSRYTMLFAAQLMYVYQIHFSSVYAASGFMFPLVIGSLAATAPTQTHLASAFGPTIPFYSASSSVHFRSSSSAFCVPFNFIVFAKWRRKINNNKAIYGRFSPRRPLRYALPLRCIVLDVLDGRFSVCAYVCVWRINLFSWNFRYKKRTTKSFIFFLSPIFLFLRITLLFFSSSQKYV